MSSPVRQYYTGSYDYHFTVKESIGYRCAQQFTVETSHEIDRVRMYVGENCAEDKKLYCDICRVDGNGHPSTVIGTASVGANEIGLIYKWVDFYFSPVVKVYAGKQYTLTLRTTAGGLFSISYDDTSPTYSGGYALSSHDSGSTWTDETDIDINFYEYGEEITPADSQYPGEGGGFIGKYAKRLIAVANNKIYYENI